MSVLSFRDLRVWQNGMSLVEQVYRLTQAFPRDEIYGLTAQTRRAAVSVPANIAEGHAREHLGEYLHHLSIAQGSLAELQTHLEIAARLGYITKDDAGLCEDECACVARQLHALRSSLQSRNNLPNPAPTPNT